MSESEIRRSLKGAASIEKQLQVLADLNACSVPDIIAVCKDILEDIGFSNASPTSSMEICTVKKTRNKYDKGAVARCIEDGLSMQETAKKLGYDISEGTGFLQTYNKIKKGLNLKSDNESRVKKVENKPDNVDKPKLKAYAKIDVNKYAKPVSNKPSVESDISKVSVGSKSSEIQVAESEKSSTVEQNKTPVSNTSDLTTECDKEIAVGAKLQSAEIKDNNTDNGLYKSLISIFGVEILDMEISSCRCKIDSLNSELKDLNNRLNTLNRLREYCLRKDNN